MTEIKTQLFNSVRRVFFARPLEKLLAGITSGKNIHSWAAKLPPNNYQYPKNTMRSVCRNEINFELDLHDMVDWHIYYDIRMAAMDSLYALFKPGQTFIDIGANMGLVTLEAAKRIGSTGKIVSFEPVPGNIARLNKNISLNALRNITLIQKALSNTSGTMMMDTVRPDNFGMYKLSNADVESNKSSITVQVSTLDEEVSTLGLNAISLIKIDVEGNELKVIQGAADTIRKFKPTLFVEVVKSDLVENNTSPAALIQLIESFHYEVFNSENYKRVSQSDSFPFMMDIIAVPK